MIDDIHKGSGCLKCPVNEFDCDAQYRGARCAALRAKEGVDFDPKTNADRIRSMSDDELAEYLSFIAYERETPWSDLFASKLCAHCHGQEWTLDDGRKLKLHECDFKDGKCPHGSDILWWLQQPAEKEGDHD